MKKFFVIFSVVLLVIVVTTSCNHLQPGPDRKITVHVDTTIYQGIPITKPLYSCNTGKRLPYDKLITITSVPMKISLSKDTIISGKDLPLVVNGGKSANNNSSLDWLWPILFGILGILIFAVALLLAAWGLHSLGKALFGKKSTEQKENKDVVKDVTPRTLVVPAVSTQKEEAETELKPEDALSGSENFRLNMKSLEILGEVLKSKDLHEVKISNKPEGFELNIKYKLGETKRAEEEKKV